MSRRTRGDGGLFQRGDGMWVGVYEVPSTDGKRRRKYVYSKDRNTLIDKLKKLRNDVDAGRIAVTGSTTVQKWLNKWLDDIHGPHLHPNTRRDYRSTIDNHIVPRIGSKKLDKLTPEHVRQMQKAIDSDRSAQKAHIVLNRALKDAVREGMLTRNVAEIADKPRYTATEREPLTVEQAKQLLNVSSNLNDPMLSRWAAALFLGARQGELLGLQWSRVNLQTGVVDLRWQLQQLQQTHGCGERHSDGTWPCRRTRVGFCPQRHWDLPRGFEHKILHRSLGLTRPKTKAGTRIVPIPAPLWALLERMPRDNNPHDLVWRHDDGRPLNPRDDYARWQDALKAADLPPAPLHVARHTTATLLMEAGVDAKVIQSVLGHANVLVTQGYTHADQTLKRQAMSNLDRLMPIELENIPRGLS